MRINIKCILTICLGAFLVIGSCTAQDQWELKKDKDGIQVYFRNAKSSKIRELKIELTVQHSFTGVVDALNDVEACSEWVYGCDLVEIFEKEGDTSMLYYTIINFPWPLKDRDAYISTHNIYTPTTYTSTSYGMDGYKDTPKMVRLPEIDIEWYVEKRSGDDVFIRYTLHSDPGGMIPAWAINLALDKGPVQSMKAFQKFLKEKY